MLYNFCTSLLALPFYRSHPFMMPFVGDAYDSPKHKKLLLVGDSFYLPEGATVHHDADSWYGTPSLTEDERNWCNTRGISSATG